MENALNIIPKQAGTGKVIKVIIEDKVLEQFGVEKVKQKIKSLREICGGRQNKMRDLYDQIHSLQRLADDWATCLKHCLCKHHLPPQCGRQTTCPPEFSLYKPHVNAA